MRTYPFKVGMTITMQKHDSIILAYRVQLYLPGTDNSTTSSTLSSSTPQSDSEVSSGILHMWYKVLKSNK